MKETRQDDRRLSVTLTFYEAKQKRRFVFGLSVLWRVALRLPTCGGAASRLLWYYITAYTLLEVKCRRVCSRLPARKRPCCTNLKAWAHNELPLPLRACRHRQRLCGLIFSHVSQHATRFVRPSPPREGRLHTPSIAFRHLPPKLCQIWLRNWSGTLYLRAPVQRRGQSPPEGSGTNMTVEGT